MASASCRTVLLAAAIGAAVLTAALPASAEPGAAGLPPEVARTPIGITAAEPGRSEEGADHQTLSTLGALALGVLGLLWVRRHTAEL